MNHKEQGDLVILVPDANMEHTVTTLLKERYKSLGISNAISFKVLRLVGDSKVFNQAHEFLREHQKNFRYALVMFDYEGSGKEGSWSREEVEQDVQRRLESAGWKGRCAVIVIEPELEAWVFARSHHVAWVIAKGDATLLKAKLNGQIDPNTGKPRHPKELMEEILREKRIPRSSALYVCLAKKVSLKTCRDPAFAKFRKVLRQWFP
jgi:hypothetical protein